MRPVYILLLVAFFSALQTQLGARLNFFAEPFVEGVYEGMNLPTSAVLTLAWMNSESETPELESVVVELDFGNLVRGPELPSGASVAFYLGGSVDLETARPFATVTLPLEATEMLAYLIPISQDRYRVTLHDLSPKLIDAGTARLVNVSSETLAVMLDNERGVIESGGSLETSLANIQRFQLQMRIAAEAEEGGWRPVHASRISAGPGDRLLILISRRFGDVGAWRVRTIRPMRLASSG